MQISNFLGQYNQAAAAGAEKVTGTKGVENLVSSLKSLTKGNIFEGTVSSIKNGRVTLALSNGSQISARMDAKVSLTVGQSMFFQVKSNDGSQIAIRPFVVDGSGVNYTLMQALSAAGLPAEPNYLSMVNKMMEEQMPIDRASLQQMARLANANGNIDVQTLVQMSKLGIEITPENAAQFENYLGDQQAITTAIDNLIDELPMAMQGSSLPEGELRAMDAKVLAIVTEGLTEEGQQSAPAAGALPDVSGSSAAAPEGNLLLEAAQRSADGVVIELAASGEGNPELIDAVRPEHMAEELPDTAVQQETTSGGEISASLTEAEASVVPEQSAGAPGAEPSVIAVVQDHTLGALLEPKQLEHLNAMLGELVNTAKLSYGEQTDTAKLFCDLQQLLKSSLPIDRDSLEQLLGSKELKLLMKDTLEQQWTIKPEELTGSDKINRLYEKLDGQMNRMADILKATGQQSANFTQAAADIHSNVAFMNQINQVYNYVQVPLKMSGQNASGELYVYTNKKALAQGDEALTAFLHLDMDHLGSTDVSVSLRGREVSTNFYLKNDAAYDLIEKYLPLLEERLQKKGYNCKISVINEAKHVNFVEDFLKKDRPSAGQLHRYSFDMRA